MSETELLFDEVKISNYEAAIELIESGIDIDTRNHHGQTAMHVAVNNNDLDMVQLLVEAKANLQLKSEGKSPFEQALCKGHVGIADMLFQRMSAQTMMPAAPYDLFVF